MTDISPENVARMLRDITLTAIPINIAAKTDEAADMLEVLFARLAEVEAERDKLVKGNRDLTEQAIAAMNRAEAAEAEVAKLLKHIKAADDYLDKGLHEKARNVTRAAIRAYPRGEAISPQA